MPYLRLRCFKVRLRHPGDQEGLDADAPRAADALPRGAGDDQGHEVHHDLLRRPVAELEFFKPGSYRKAPRKEL